jgi:hypothetical protein
VSDDGEMVDLVVRGLTRDEMDEVADGSVPNSVIAKIVDTAASQREREDHEKSVRALNARRERDGLPRLVEEGEKRDARDHAAEAEAWVQRTAQKTDEWVARQRSTYARAEEPCGSESADVRVRAFQKVPQEIQAKAMEAATAEIAAEASDATSYTDEQGRRLWLERGEGGVAIAAPDGDPLVPHPALLAAVNAARERDGLPRLVEESVDGACSDPTCSYRAEMDGLSAACKGMGCQVSPVLSEILLAEDSP